MNNKIYWRKFILFLHCLSPIGQVFIWSEMILSWFQTPLMFLYHQLILHLPPVAIFSLLNSPPQLALHILVLLYFLTQVPWFFLEESLGVRSNPAFIVGKHHMLMVAMHFLHTSRYCPKYCPHGYNNTVYVTAGCFCTRGLYTGRRCSRLWSHLPRGVRGDELFAFLVLA